MIRLPYSSYQARAVPEAMGVFGFVMLWIDAWTLDDGYHATPCCDTIKYGHGSRRWKAHDCSIADPLLEYCSRVLSSRERGYTVVDWGDSRLGCRQNLYTQTRCFESTLKTEYNQHPCRLRQSIECFHIPPTSQKPLSSV